MVSAFSSKNVGQRKMCIIIAELFALSFRYSYVSISAHGCTAWKGITIEKEICSWNSLQCFYGVVKNRLLERRK